MLEVDCAPFFVVGSPRSGTTMLRLMLNMHSRLRVPSESWFLRPLCERLPLRGPLSDRDRSVAFQEISRENWWKGWEASEEMLKACIFEPPAATLAELADRVFRGTARLGCKVRWGDKTPSYASYLPQLSEVFPRAKFIHLIRDARDVAISMRNAGWHGRSIRRATRSWSGHVEDALRGRELVPGRYLEIHYEDIVLEPRAMLEKICVFLDEGFEEGMLNFNDSAAAEIPNWHLPVLQKTLRPPRQSDVGRWKTEFSPFETALVEAYAGATMRRVGQECAGVPPWTALASVWKSLQLAWCGLVDLRVRVLNRLRRRA